jgi:SOS-response transcriptional repressor LexA
VVAKVNGHGDASFMVGAYRPRGRRARKAFDLVPLNADYASIQSDRCQIFGTVIARSWDLYP